MPTVLIVDPCAQTRLVLTPLLQEQGYELQWSPDSKAALALLWEKAFGIIIVDTTDPASGGESLLEALKGIDPSGSQKRAAFVRSGDQAQRDRLLGLGCAAVLVKPINFHDLTEVLSDLAGA